MPSSEPVLFTLGDKPSSRLGRSNAFESAKFRWKYPTSEEVLREVGLRRISEYITVRRNTIAHFIVNRPLFEDCERGERRRGSSPRQLWWEQPVDLESARAAAAATAAAIAAEVADIDGLAGEQRGLG